MDRASISRIEEWDSRPVTGGYAGLNELADSGFTGAASAGGTRLVMLNGRVVGVFDGDIATFEDGDITAYEAPDPALPLLFAMWERDAEVRGQYYTDDTPIGEVDETLSSGGFTGYLELSENVLSGDYYLVYYGGRSLSVAFVGNKRRVVTGDEAFQLAADEVGIYEVRAVDLDVTDVPEPTADARTEAATVSTGADEDGSEGGDAPETPETPDTSDTDSASAPDADTAVDATDDEPADGERKPDADADDEDEMPASEDGPDTDGGGEGVPEPGEPAGTPPITEAEPTVASREDTTAEPTERTEAASTDRGGSTGDDGRPEGGPETPPSGVEGAGAAGEPPEGADPDERFEEEARWREARTVPALDPDESEQPVVERPAPTNERVEDSREETTAEATPSGADVDALRERLQELETQLEASERERRRLSERLEEAVDERDEVKTDREALESRIDELEAELREAEATPSQQASEPTSADGDAPRGRSVQPETALDQTDLFVRYGSKGKATLQTAHEGRAGRDEVDENLRIETHSRFDTGTATVEDRPFDDYLERTIQYRFVSWLVEDLLYEIQDTGSESGLRALYDVLPEVDRAEFNGSVTGQDEEGEGDRKSFDVVCRDRMGKPLVVANINDSLDPATGDMMVRLVEDGTAAAEAHDSIGAAFFVTASFFEPNALETVAEATRGGGILSRESKKSFVKLARTGGYHLCLVEARGDDFHVAVPEF